MVKVLFICTRNSARSQMAEGLLRTMYGDRYQVLSAGTEPVGVDPFAVKAMQEIGIDISHHRSKSIKEFADMQIDYVVTLCEQAKEVCPFFPATLQSLHKSFDDPASAEGTDEERLEKFRRIGQEIKSWIEEVFGVKDGT